MTSLLLQTSAFFASHIVLILTFSLGLGFRESDFKLLFRARLLAKAFLLAHLLVPLIAISFVQIFSIGPIAAGILILFSISPGVPFMVTGPQKKFVSKSTSISLSLILTFSCIFTLPLWLTILGNIFPIELSISIPALFRILFANILIPFLFGWTLRKTAPGTSQLLSPWVTRLLNLAFLFTVLLILMASLSSFSTIHLAEIITMFALIGLSALVGDTLGRPKLEDRALLASSAINGNPTIVLLVIQTSFPELKIAPALAIYLLLRAVSATPYAFWIRRQSERITQPHELSHG